MTMTESLDVYVSADNKEIWDRNFFENTRKQIDSKKYRLDSFEKASNRLKEMNSKFNGNTAGKI